MPDALRRYGQLNSPRIRRDQGASAASNSGLPAGFAEVLVPLANGPLLGVERDADSSGRVGGLKLALFVIANPASPSERASLSLSLGAVGSSSSALDSSRHHLNLLVLGDVACVALPDNLANTATTAGSGAANAVKARVAAPHPARGGRP